MAHTHKNGKVAIPKLDRGPPPPPKVPSQNREDRVSRACKTCRKRKVKCSGGIPQCDNCQANGLTCVYEQARRDRLKEAVDLNHTFVTLLTELSEKLSEDDKKRVQDVIDAAEDDMLNPQTAPSVGSLGKRVRKSFTDESLDHNSPTKKPGEAHVTASVGSNEDLDFLEEDLLRTRESRETGFVGQNSEVQWLRSVQRQSQEDVQPYGQPYGPPGTSEHAIDQRSKALHQRREGHPGRTRHVTDTTFYLDSENIELDIVVNPYELPDPEIAEQLLDCYIYTMHSSFPIVTARFEDQVRRFIVSLKHNRAFQVPDRWRALLNVVFAIGAKYSHLIGAEWQGDERDHLVYMTRASHLLGMNGSVMFTSAPDLSLVQATAVLSLYFLVIGHVSRAWLMVGVSIRLALALGLHLRNEDPGADFTKKEMLSRTWWSLHSIECLVSSITGRPPVLANEDCTVPLPKALTNESRPATKRRPYAYSNLPSEERSSGTGNSADSDGFLIGTINISLLTQRVLTGLYAPRTAIQSWQDIQGRIKSLLQDLEDWSTDALPAVTFDSGSLHSQDDRETLILRMHYLSTKILITRPCLCRTERRIKNESSASANFNSEMASACVSSAREFTALLPREFDVKFAYKKAPWWNIIHLIMQCAAVLLLEIGYQSQHTEDHNDAITFDLQKLMNWLRAMQPMDPVAARAHRVVRRILQNVAPTLQSKAAELLTEEVASDAANEQSSSPFATPYRRQQSSANWAHGDFFDGSAPVIGQQYYPLSMNQDSQDTLQSSYGHQYYPPGLNQDSQGTSQSSNDHLMYGGYPFQNTHFSSTFGNPFMNSWDEVMPVVDMQDLWNDITFPSLDMPDVSDTHQYVAQPHQQQPSNSAATNVLLGQQHRRE